MIDVKTLAKIALSITFALTFTYTATDIALNRAGRYVIHVHIYEDGVALEDSFPELSAGSIFSPQDAAPVEVKREGKTWIIWPMWALEEHDDSLKEGR